MHFDLKMNSYFENRKFLKTNTDFISHEIV